MVAPSTHYVKLSWMVHYSNIDVTWKVNWVPTLDDATYEYFCLILMRVDPRFEGGGGSSKLNYDIFRKAYGFLESYQDTEIEDLKKSLKKEKNQVIFASIMPPCVLFCCVLCALILAKHPNRFHHIFFDTARPSLQRGVQHDTCCSSATSPGIIVVFVIFVVFPAPRAHRLCSQSPKSRLVGSCCTSLDSLRGMCAVRNFARKSHKFVNPTTVHNAVAHISIIL